MNKGKVTCEVLKEIRKQIADQNGIDYQTRECTFEGECRGTCPVCESEIHYLESEIVKKKYLGKAVVLAGLSVGLISGMTGCGTDSHRKPNIPIIDENQKKVINKNDNLSIAKPQNQKIDTQLNVLEGIILKNIKPPFIDDSTIKVEKDPFANDIIFDTNELIMDVVLGDIPPPGGMPILESMPEFPGGTEEFNNYLKKEIVYPKKCKTDSISGVVFVEFFVEKDGTVSEVKTINNIHPDLNAEAIRVIQNSPVWKPGKQFGKPVRVKYQIPIRFNLQ